MNTPQTHLERQTTSGGSKRRPAAILIVLAVGAALGLRSLLEAPAIPAETIRDPQFVAAANQACARVLPAIRAERPGRKEVVSVAETIRRSTHDNRKLKELNEKLRALPVQPENAAAVERWLQRWEHFTDVGDSYVATLKASDNPTDWQTVADQGNDDFLRISAFAAKNAMPACALDQAFPRAAEEK